MPDQSNDRLDRSLGFWALVAYGVGDILGAGIYGLVGKVAGRSGWWAPASFLAAMIVASLTAYSYSELVRRFPRSGGAAHFCHVAFRNRYLTLMLGWLVLCSGVVSMATVANVFAGYCSGLVPDTWSPVVVVTFLTLLAGVNFLGISLSSKANIVCTIAESSGLLIVLGLGLYAVMIGRLAPATEVAPTTSAGVLFGGVLAFFAFVGFEDLVNIAEEARRPERDLRYAILLAIGATGVLYLLIALVSIAVVGPAKLAASEAPLVEVVRTAMPSFPLFLFTIITLFAVSNTALLNGIMASRLLYGLSEQRVLPQFLSRVHADRKTPHVAIIVVLVFTVLLALSGTVEFLASTSSLLILIAFSVVNLALIVVVCREQKDWMSRTLYAAIPTLAVASCITLSLFASGENWQRALVLLGIGIVIILVAVVGGRGRTNAIDVEPDIDA